MKHYALLYIATLAIMSVLDIIFLAGIARDFYRSHITNLEFKALPAILFYLMYAAGVLVFVSGNSVNWQHTLIYGALLGFFAYATYDLTNLATLRGWSPVLVVVDIAWGTFVTSVATTAAFMLVKWFEG